MALCGGYGGRCGEDLCGRQVVCAVCVRGQACSNGRQTVKANCLQGSRMVVGAVARVVEGRCGVSAGRGRRWHESNVQVGKGRHKALRNVWGGGQAAKVAVP